MRGLHRKLLVLSSMALVVLSAAVLLGFQGCNKSQPSKTEEHKYAVITLHRVEQAAAFVDVTEEDLQAYPLLKTILTEIEASGKDEISHQTTIPEMEALLLHLEQKSEQKYGSRLAWNNTLQYHGKFYEYLRISE